MMNYRLFPINHYKSRTNHFIAHFALERHKMVLKLRRYCSMNILIIDDDADFLYILAHTVRKQGYTVFTALNGRKALDTLGENDIDLIISDVIMTDTPILSLTCTLKTLYPETPIVLISGIPNDHLASKSMSLGADTFLSKPVNMNLLFSTINQLSA
jgi:DNA-binding NtrC family response regulator